MSDSDSPSKEQRRAAMAGELRHIAISVLPGTYFVAMVTQYRWYFLGLFLAVAAGVWSEWVHFSSWSRSREILLRLLVFIVLLGTSAVWALSPLITLTGIMLPVAFSLLFWSVAGWAQEQPLVRQTTPLVVMTWSIALVYAYVFATYGTLKPIDDDVAKVFGAGSNAGAMHLVAVLPLLVWRTRAKPDMLSWLTLVLAAALLLASETRAAYLAAPLVVIATVLSSIGGIKQKLRRILAVVAATVVAGMLAGMTSSGQATLARLQATALSLTDPLALLDPQQSDYERAITYFEGWQAFLEKPILGIGYQNLQFWLDARYGFSASSHNLLVTLIAESGWPATLAFAALLVGFFSRLSHGSRMDPRPLARGYYSAVAIAMAGILLLAMFHQLLEFQVFYILLGMAMAAPALRDFDPRGQSCQRVSAVINADVRAGEA